ncbi:hypothetical protein D9619_007646 [Psilocybe cf. subviscida]|uniref:Uncharacterized protein n=1 Tax=Psilocybe cf. subviscida TaxID=2480587 RepID=A0A8H5AUG4_9AGAR|nr:hypothetical protein D9619_007646 [Psilocybe cf. subviscida]
MPVYRSRTGDSISIPTKPFQRKTIALPFDDPQDALVLPYILSEIYSSTEDDSNALGLSGLPEDTNSAAFHPLTVDATDAFDVASITSGIATMSAITPVQSATRVTSPRVRGHGRGSRSSSTLSPTAFSSSSSRYLGRTGNNLLGHILGAVSPPLSPTHGGPITTVNFG